MERTYRVRTPEMVEFTFPVAGLASRFLAWLVDALCMVGVLALILIACVTLGLVSSAAAGPAGLITSIAVAVFFAFLVSWGWSLAFEAAWDGRTPGKRLVGLRVIGDSGVRITIAQAAIRNFFRVLDSLPLTYVLGAIAHLVSPRGQRIGDVVAGTVVVREEKRSVPSRIGFPEAKYNSFLEDPALAARIARRVRQDERELLLELLLRRDELELATRTELFGRLAKHLSKKLELPESATFLSDEKLVMNVTQAVIERERARAVVAG
jgi:uncharacterized RDD family membrane protein YckC